ncbi:MAG: MarR family transcriptional regulator [Acidobacteria bacterium]|nr:MarR family transcriptional regulator [Acidobacteriota bacterium]NIQ84659.1 MarR family transcriptional regulator [Acidobacteriota bacterium]NIT10559.1 MarR family transcriptional regulator [Acidobacteriota bacterium]
MLNMTGIDAERARTVREGVQLLVRRFSISERAEVSCCGLTVAQSATLATLLAEGPLRLGTLGKRLGITASTLTRNVDRLEESGLVEREADPEDARAIRVRLTGAGRAAAARVARQEQEFAESVLARVPPGRRAELVRSLELLLSAVVDATQTCCPGAFDHLLEGFPRTSSARRRKP